MLFFWVNAYHNTWRRCGKRSYELRFIIHILKYFNRCFPQFIVAGNCTRHFNNAKIAIIYLRIDRTLLI